jgi:hypothetical protein
VLITLEYRCNAGNIRFNGYCEIGLWKALYLFIHKPSMQKLIPLIEVEDDREFFKGERFRIYNVGIRNTTPETDYYEYMLVYDHSNHMLLANVTSEAGRSKAGYVICHVQLANFPDRIVVSGKEIKRMLGTDKTFYLLK